MRSILIIKTSSIGDVIQTMPVLVDLRKRFPHAEIHWVVEETTAPLLAAHPLLDRVLVIDTKKWRRAPFKKETWRALRLFYKELTEKSYDLLFDLQGNSKSALITSLARAKEKVGFSWSSLPEKLNCLVTNYRYAVSSRLPVKQFYLTLVEKHLGGGNPSSSNQLPFTLTDRERERVTALNAHLTDASLMVAFGSKWKNKRLKEETLFHLLSLISKKYRPFFLFPYGSLEEEVLAKKWHEAFSTHSLAIGDLSLPLWHALMKSVDGVLSMDSTALHLAAAASTPTFSFFGPSSSAVYKPEGDLHHAFQGSCPYGRTFDKRCPLLRSCATGACLQEADPSLLFEDFEKWWTLLMRLTPA
jgi:heptosyltransferase I